MLYDRVFNVRLMQVLYKPILIKINNIQVVIHSILEKHIILQMRLTNLRHISHLIVKTLLQPNDHLACALELSCEPASGMLWVVWLYCFCLFYFLFEFGVF